MRAQAVVLPHRAARRSTVEAVVHRVLVSGVTAASLFLIAGVLAAVVEWRALPREAVPTRGLLHALGRGTPGGFVSVGLGLLILTPVVRVVGSIFAFARCSDYRFAAITFLVLSLMVVSMLLGLR